nr:natural cytotoxicity triggering receptor 3 ligand 1-like [Macaca nemestrina]
MGNRLSLACTPLECIMKHWDSYDPRTLKKKWLIFFRTKEAPNIRRKLQKEATGPDTTLENLLRMATLVFYSRNQEDVQEKERKHREGQGL